MKGTKPQLVVDNGNAKIREPEAAPDWMSEEAQAEWRRVLPEVIQCGALTDLDRGSLENYCVSVGRTRQLEKMLDAADPTQFLRISRMQNTAMQTAKQLAAELGLTPMSRSRKPMRGGHGGEDGDDLLSRLDL